MTKKKVNDSDEKHNDYSKENRERTKKKNK